MKIFICYPWRTKWTTNKTAIGFGTLAGKSYIDIIIKGYGLELTFRDIFGDNYWEYVE